MYEVHNINTMELIDSIRIIEYKKKGNVFMNIEISFVDYRSMFTPSPNSLEL